MTDLDLPGDLALEALGLLLGKQVGAGASRKVFTCAWDTSCVIKVEERDPDGAGYFQNVAEWNVWQEVEFSPIKGWFAPCISISPSGRVLMQRRTTRPMAFPARLPAFLDDTQMSNYGMYEERFVCHDYGFTELMRFGMTKRMRRVDWIQT